MEGKGNAMALAKDVTDLAVYKLAFDLQQQVFGISKGFPAEEKYSLTDQIRRSSRSVGANICEAWKKRRYPAHFVSKLTDADGEQAETCHWLSTAMASGYLDQARGTELTDGYRHISGMLNKMIQEAPKWCSHAGGGRGSVERGTHASLRSYAGQALNVEGGERDGRGSAEC